jgi:hypothetical protein
MARWREARRFKERQAGAGLGEDRIGDDAAGQTRQVDGKARSGKTGRGRHGEDRLGRRVIQMEKVSTQELEERLEAFRQALKLCDQIDSWARVLRCREINQAHIDRLKAEIARRTDQRGKLWAAGRGNGK